MPTTTNYTLITLPTHTDCRGTLTVVQNTDQLLPFPIHRVFWITNIPNNQTRGGHLHLSQWEALFPLSGSFDITINNGTRQTLIHLDQPHKGIIIPPGLWSQLSNLTPGTVILALCDADYDATGYRETPPTPNNPNP